MPANHRARVLAILISLFAVPLVSVARSQSDECGTNDENASSAHDQSQESQTQGSDDASECADDTDDDAHGDPDKNDKDTTKEADEENSDPIYLATGEFHYEAVDLRIAGSNGHDFVWKRVYRSRLGPTTAQGAHWDFSCNKYIRADGDRRLVFAGDARKVTFGIDGHDHWVTKRYFRELHRIPDGRYVLTLAGGEEWVFAALDGSPAGGRILEERDRHGNSIRFDYDTGGRLIAVRDSLDSLGNPRVIRISYDGRGFISAVTDFTGRQVRYTYYDDGDPNGAGGDLATVTTPAVVDTNDYPLPAGAAHRWPSGKTTRYTYTAGFTRDGLDHRMKSITDPNGQTFLRIDYAFEEPGYRPGPPVQFLWGPSGTSTSAGSVPPGTDAPPLHPDRVTWMQAGNGAYQYTYYRLKPVAGTSDAVRMTVVNDRVGNVEELLYDDRNLLVRRVEYTGRADPSVPTTLFTNRPGGKLRSDDPDFYLRRYEYDQNYMLTRLVHPNGNEERFVYDTGSAFPRSRGNLLRHERHAGPRGGDQPTIVERFEYEPHSNLVVRHVDGRGLLTNYTRGLTGNATRIVHPLVTTGVATPQVVQEDFEYDAIGRMTARIHPDDGSGHRRRDEFHYYAEGPQTGYRMGRVIDAGGFDLATVWHYNRVGRVIREFDSKGNDSRFLVNQLDQVVMERSREVDLDGTKTRYVRESFFDANDNLARVEVQNVDETGAVPVDESFTTTYEHDVLDRRTRTSREIGPGRFVVTEYTYDANENRVLTRRGESTNGNQPHNAVLVLFDERDLPFRVARGVGGLDASTTQYDYDGNRNVIRVRDGLEQTPRLHRLSFDGFDRIWGAAGSPAVVDPEGNEFRLQYDANGKVTQLRVDGELREGISGANVRLHEESFLFDELNRLVRTEAKFFDLDTGAPRGGDGLVTTDIHFAANSLVSEVVDDNGHARRWKYDTANRVSVQTDAKGNEVRFSYDANSSRTKREEIARSDLGTADQKFTTTFAYDGLDRLVEVADDVGNTHRLAYDSRGNVVRSEDALGTVVRRTFDGLDREVLVVRDVDGDGAAPSDPDDVTTAIAWDDSSRLTTRTDANGNTTRYAFDDLDRLKSITFADASVWSVAYDVHDNAVKVIDPNETEVTMMYDLRDRLVQRTIARGEGILGTTTESYTWDGMSRIVEASDDDSTVKRVFDSRSNLLEETLVHGSSPSGVGTTVTSTYDGVGNRLTFLYPGGRLLATTYDELDRISTLADGPGLVASYAYVGADRVERRTFGNGTRLDVTHDGVTGIPNTGGDFGFKQVTRHRHSVESSGAAIDDRTFAWDPMQRKNTRSDELTGVTHRYGRDGLHRLISTEVTDASNTVLRSTDYTIDGVHNRRVVAGNPDAGSHVGLYALVGSDAWLNQYTTTPDDEREHDDNGNLVARRAPGGAPLLSEASYDYRNQMLEYRDVQSGRRHVFAYDCFGRRVAKTVDVDGAATVTRYVYDVARVCEEQDEAGSTLVSYVYGNELDEVLNARRGSLDEYYHADDMLNVMKLTDGQGTVIDAYDYGDYGEPLDGATLAPIASFATANRYLFQGRRYDTETGLYWYRSRYLDPVVGRFTSRDPIGIWGDVAALGNGFAFAAGDPWTFLDPLGLDSDPIDDALEYYKRGRWDYGKETMDYAHDYYLGFVDALIPLPDFAKDFLRENGLLWKYKGTGGEELAGSITDKLLIFFKVNKALIEEGGEAALLKLLEWVKENLEGAIKDAIVEKIEEALETQGGGGDKKGADEGGSGGDDSGGSDGGSDPGAGGGGDSGGSGEGGEGGADSGSSGSSSGGGGGSGSESGGNGSKPTGPINPWNGKPIQKPKNPWGK